MSPRDRQATRAFHQPREEPAVAIAPVPADCSAKLPHRYGDTPKFDIRSDQSPTANHQPQLDGPTNQQEVRRLALMSRQVETGLIFMEMLGSGDAVSYWRAAAIPEQVIDRLLNGRAGRTHDLADGLSAAWLDVPVDPHVSLFYCSSGRRRDLIGAAVVQAAIAIHQELGRERAEGMLRREGFDKRVIERVLAGDRKEQRS